MEDDNLYAKLDLTQEQADLAARLYEMVQVKLIEDLGEGVGRHVFVGTTLIQAGALFGRLANEEKLAAVLNAALEGQGVRWRLVPLT
jgi:hypothetical protein